MEASFRTYPILKPVSWIWAAFTSVRNLLFEKGIYHAESFRIPVISVGNITVGGTGKSPHTYYIASLTQNRRGAATAILSRGYRRHTSGFRIVSPSDTYLTVGDEPLMLSLQLPDVCVAVDENRVNGIRTLINKVKPQVIVLDDAFQHRRVSPSLNILLVDYNRNILQDSIIPAGRLRESASNRNRADIIIVTKCPSNLDEIQMDELSSTLPTNDKQSVFFSTISYGALYSLIDRSEYTPHINTPILAVSGIASTGSFTDHLRSISSSVSLMSFPDHHSFNGKDIEKIDMALSGLGSEAVIVVTEKDAVRLKSLNLPSGLRKRIYVLPISARFLKNEELFDKTIIDHIESFSK